MMQKYIDINQDGYSIRCKLYYDKDMRNIPHMVIATYGFGGNKDNKAVEKFAERLIAKYHGYGILCFDWPCHGKDARNKFILDECISYLDIATRYARDEFHAEQVFNYSSSFGAYITLRLLHEHAENPYEKIAFRCPAIKMYDAMAAHITEEDWAQLGKGKEILRGYDRKIKISREFLDDMKEHDVSTYDFLDYADAILMVHGTKDDMAPFEVAQTFSEQNVIELIPVENADHPFSNPTYMDLAINEMIGFFQ